MIILLNGKNRVIRIMKNMEKLDKSLVLHHKAKAKGYVSRKHMDYISPYKGKFGEGVLIIHPRFDTSRFVDIEYYIIKNQGN